MARISIKDLTVEFAIFGASSRSLKNTIVAQATGGRVMAGARQIVERGHQLALRQVARGAEDHHHARLGPPRARRSHRR